MVSAVSKHRFFNFFIGLGVTFSVQSGVAVINSVLGLIYSGLMNTRQAVSFLMGAHFAAGLIGLIFSLTVYVNSMWFFALAVPCFVFIKFEKAKAVGFIFLGLGLSSWGLTAFITGLADLGLPILSLSPFLFIVAGIVLLLTLQSFVFSLTFIFGGFAADLLSFEHVLWCLLGLDVGWLVLLFISGVKHKVTHRTLVFYSSLTILAIIPFAVFQILFFESGGQKSFWNFWLLSPSLKYLAAFSVSLLCLGGIDRIFGKIMPPIKQIQRLRVFGFFLTTSPVLVMAQVRQELDKFMAMVQAILNLTQQSFAGSPDDLERVLKYEKITDNIYSEIQKSVEVIQRHSLFADQENEIHRTLKVINELEGIADECEKLITHFSSTDEERKKQISIELEVLIHAYEDILAEKLSLSDLYVIKEAGLKANFKAQKSVPAEKIEKHIYKLKELFI